MNLNEWWNASAEQIASLLLTETEKIEEKNPSISLLFDFYLLCCHWSGLRGNHLNGIDSKRGR